MLYRKKEFDNLTYDKYNYNILKIRNGLYYSKTLLENIDSLFDEYNFHNIIDNNKIKLYDELINDKTILDVYNKTNSKILEINKESEILINETYDYFLNDFKMKYSFKNDYSPLIKIFKGIIKFENNNFHIYIEETINKTINDIIALMSEFNQTILHQISIKENYTYYNFNQTYFNNLYSLYKSHLTNIFIKNNENITNLVNNYIFHNSIKMILSKLLSSKRKYIKSIINDFSQNYDFNLLNFTFDLGEKIEKHLEKEYNEYEFTFIYSYVEMFENLTKNYINKNILNLNIIKKETFDIFENIYSNFLNQLKSNASSFINSDFIQNLQYNQTKCKIYSNYTELDYLYNITDDDKYTNITNNINIAFSHCINNTFEND